MNKNLRKDVMKRSPQRNNFLKNKTKKIKKAYQTQQISCVNLFIRKNKKFFFCRFLIKDLCDNKNNLETIKPL